MSGKRVTLIGTVAAVALVAGAAAAIAGGFAIREQSAESQGASFAGNAAGTSLGAMYWNPAAAANKTRPGHQHRIELQPDHPARRAVDGQTRSPVRRPVRWPALRRRAEFQ